MTAALSGKWVWIWNWSRCDSGDPAKVGARRREGLAVGAWAYLYGRDPAGEARLVAETVSYGQADLFVLDVEAEFEGRPEAADELGGRAREAVGSDYPLYYSSFAIARHHRSFPYEEFARHCQGAAPQVYWNAFGWPALRSVRWMYEDYAAVQAPPQRLFPVAGLYSAGGIPYPTADDVKAFVSEAAGNGSPGGRFWSYEHMNEEMWAAVRDAPNGWRESSSEEVEMSSLEFQQLSSAHAALAERIARLEAEVSALKDRWSGSPGRPTPSARTYTVRPGDTLSAIAAGLAIGDWRAPYQAHI